MTASSIPAIERIARVLAGDHLSSNAEGAEPSAGAAVDQRWPEYVPQAEAVLKSLRDPPPEVAGLGHGDTWSAAIAAALGEEPGEGGTLGESLAHFLKAPN